MGRLSTVAAPRTRAEELAHGMVERRVREIPPTNCRRPAFGRNDLPANAAASVELFLTVLGGGPTPTEEELAPLIAWWEGGG
jgi:hypothetical protein